MCASFGSIDEASNRLAAGILPTVRYQTRPVTMSPNAAPSLFLSTFQLDIHRHSLMVPNVFAQRRNRLT